MKKLTTEEKQAVQNILENLKPKNIKQKTKKSMQLKKEQSLNQSLSFDEIAKMHGIATRRLKEFLSLKRVPKLPRTKTAMLLIEQNYRYDPELKRWFPK